MGGEQSDQCFPIPSRPTPEMAKKFGSRHAKGAPGQSGVAEKRYAGCQDSSGLPLQAAAGTSLEATARRVGRGGPS